jgi:hypothetical protein
MMLDVILLLLNNELHYFSGAEHLIQIAVSLHNQQEIPKVCFIAQHEILPNPSSEHLLEADISRQISPPRPLRENPAAIAQTYTRTYPVSQCKITLTEDYRIFNFNRTQSLKNIIHDFFGKRQVIGFVCLFFP